MFIVLLIIKQLATFEVVFGRNDPGGLNYSLSQLIDFGSGNSGATNSPKCELQTGQH